MFEKGESISDIVHNLQVEQSFNTSEDIITAGNFNGALRDIYEGIEQANEYEVNLERAYKELQEEF